MSRNGPLALGFHAVVVLFMMAPLVVGVPGGIHTREQP